MTTYVGVFSNRIFDRKPGAIGIFVAHRFRAHEGYFGKPWWTRDRDPSWRAAWAASQQVMKYVLEDLNGGGLKFFEFFNDECDADVRLDILKQEILRNENWLGIIQKQEVAQAAITTLQAMLAPPGRRGKSAFLIGKLEKRLAELERELSGMRLDNVPRRPADARQNVHDLVFRPGSRG